MINFLPDEEKRELVKMERRRLFEIAGVVFLVCAACLSFVLFSLKIYLLEEIDRQKIFMKELAEKYKSSDFSAFEDMIKKYNADLAKINDFYEEKEFFSDALKIISRIEKPVGLRVESISAERKKEDGIIAVSVSGISDTRDNLLRFRDNISADSAIKSVFFPPDNWTKETNISFYFVFSATPKNRSY